MAVNCCSFSYPFDLISTVNIWVEPELIATEIFTTLFGSFSNNNLIEKNPDKNFS